MMNDRSEKASQLLHALGHTYTRSSEKQRGLVMLLLAYHINPSSPSLLCCLAKAFIEQGQSERAISVLEELEQLQAVGEEKKILRSRALWNLGKRDNARQNFVEFITSRSTL